jgi:hypothetical protein
MSNGNGKKPISYGDVYALKLEDYHIRWLHAILAGLLDKPDAIKDMGSYVLDPDMLPDAQEKEATFLRVYYDLAGDRAPTMLTEPGRPIIVTSIDARLSDPAELSGVLNRAIDYLPQIRQHGITETASMQQAHAEFREATDPLAVWLNNATVVDPGAVVGKEELRSAYDRVLLRRGLSPLNEQAFGRAFKRLRPTVQEAQRTYQGQGKTRVYLGIALKSGDF